MGARPLGDSTKVRRRGQGGRAMLVWAVVVAVLVAAGLGKGWAAGRNSDFEREYGRRLQATAADDLAGRLALAQWLFERRAYLLAQRHAELLEIRLAQGKGGDADLLAKARVLRAAAERRLESPQPSAADEPATQPSPLMPRLSTQQVNILRVWEADTREHPRVVVPQAVLQEVFTKYAADPRVPKGQRPQREALAWPGWRQLELLFAVRAREFYGRVQVLDEPAGLRTYREVIQPQYLLASCASAPCHGGQQRGGWGLYRDASASIQTAYTNFYILTTVRTPQGAMIDRDQPAQSLLAQYGLPRDQADQPHPDVPGWRPALRGKMDPMHRTVVQWIERQLYRPAPDYGIVPAEGGS